jgi:hypothetical protein
MDAHEWITVYTVSDPVQGEIIKNALNSEGIRCTLEGELQAGEAGVAAMPIKVQVPASDADRARKFVVQHEHVAPSRTR